MVETVSPTWPWRETSSESISREAPFALSGVSRVSRGVLLLRVLAALREVFEGVMVFSFRFGAVRC